MPITRLALRLIEYPAPDYLVAEACSMSTAKLSQLASGQQTLKPELAIRLSHLFQCNPNDVMGWAAEGDDYHIIDTPVTNAMIA